MGAAWLRRGNFNKVFKINFIFNKKTLILYPQKNGLEHNYARI